mmetsp:Transcript_29897/g.47505  ORF Transcript_29897/g.47505 Transcript_29897/m.47505 type:complete len:488 (-) Transcript_29897:2952-4415(-)|eukprot:CAMPEP_0203754008 /NCGR_PEP_ID=MMETSP0098-20131031/7680_1 /ASSEMBLY_ACC=CAM_ASM_000208 /TAXON_ID=96639 /ORGANISM=" , Strain NY0313808BC1" /LENGTH=487 /DNA_ID=CAMNT_0050644849 /DNA_START=41 /DNA_END=1504 /DNA_ORIENTATION=+
MGGIVAKDERPGEDSSGFADITLKDPKMNAIYRCVVNEAERVEGDINYGGLEQAKEEIERLRGLLKEVATVFGEIVNTLDGDIPDKDKASSSGKYILSTENATKPCKSTVISTINGIEIDDDGNELKVNQYILGKLLGLGAFGVVVRCVNEANGINFAMKVLDKKRLTRKRVGMFDNAYSNVKREIAIQKKLKHPNVLPLVEVINSDSKTYLVSNLVNGGAMMPDAMKWEPIDKSRRRHLFCQLISALDYLHAQNIIHRDVKPSNLLVESGTDHLYLSDFGAAQMFDNQELPLINSTEGTMAFFAPEMCTGDDFDGKKADIWAAGATLFMMAYGFPPFIASNQQELLDTVEVGLVKFPDASSGVEDSLVDLLKGILNKDVEKRLCLGDIARHNWATENGKVSSTLSQREDYLQVIDPSTEEVDCAVSTLRTHSLKLVCKTIIMFRRMTSPTNKLSRPSIRQSVPSITDTAALVPKASPEQDGALGPQ